jgi:hypothetical protein
LVAHIDRTIESSLVAGQLRVQCFAAGCRKSIPQKLVLAVSVLAAEVAHKLDEDEIPSVGGVACMAPPLYPNFSTYAICGICCNLGPLVNMCACHIACRECIVRWADGQIIPSMITQKSLRAIPCLYAGVGCEHMICETRLIALSPAAKKLAGQLKKRTELQQNELFPSEVQVECRDPMCVGIGYLGHETVMCFICEEQYPAEVFAAPVAREVTPTCTEAYVDLRGRTITCKRCPKCDVRITKDGGCDHMRCGLCSHEWWWSTGKSYRT